MVVDHLLEPFEVAVGFSDAAARGIENRCVALAAAARRKRDDLSLWCVGWQRETPCRRLGHAWEVADVRIQVHQLLLVELRERRNDAPGLLPRVIDLRKRHFAPGEIGAVAAFAFGAMTVLAGRSVAIPDPLSCSLFTGR